MRQNTIPFAEGELRTNVTITWDVQIVKLAGLNRWRFIVPVFSLRFMDGTPVSGYYKTFVHFKNASFLSIAFDVRLGWVTNNPFSASAVEVFADRAHRDNFSGELSILFKAFGSQCAPLGVQKDRLKRDPKNKMRAIASGNIHICHVPPTPVDP